MMAMSPGFSRPASRFVRRSNRATPVTPESPLDAARRSVASFIVLHGATEGGYRLAATRSGRACPRYLRAGDRPFRVPSSARSAAAEVSISAACCRAVSGTASGEHPGQLRDPVGTVDDADGADPAVGAVLGLVDDDVLIGIGGYLRQVGDDDHLIVPAQPGQPAADFDRRSSPHSRVDLVEHQRGDVLAGRTEAHLDGQHDARQLAT